jgi:hypothetical protein
LRRTRLPAPTSTRPARRSRSPTTPPAGSPPASCGPQRSINTCATCATTPSPPSDTSPSQISPARSSKPGSNTSPTPA